VELGAYDLVSSVWFSQPRLAAFHAVFGPARHSSAYPWFCRLELDAAVPDHSTFSRNRHGRFRESDLLLAARHKLPARHLETLLQGLVHAKILKGVRGPRGGYELARERRRITIGEIVRTAMSLSTADPEDLGSNSVLLERVIDPAVRRAGETFLSNLDSITVEQMCETAEKTHVLDDEKVSVLDDEKVSGDFAI
jgi:Rrf2 family iron-sulfur cluster assembly transcriptional regulator